MIKATEDILNSNNFQLITNKKKGDWLEADSNGKLYVVSGQGNKIWFVIKNIFTCKTLFRRTVATVQETCQKLIASICANSKIPLYENTGSINHYRNAVEKLIHFMKRTGFAAYDKPLYRDMKNLIRNPEIIEASLALKQGIKPEMLAAGVSGSYLLRDRLKRPLGIFKPAEQEPGQKGNPRHLEATSVKKLLNAFKIESGTSYLRERAVYLLDHEHFAGVPKTTKAHFFRTYFGQGPNAQFHGSFQQFVPECDHAWAYHRILPKYFSSAKDVDKIPDHEIHKIAILDIRTLNCDRHMQNFLVDSDFRIHPIDHGYALPGDASSIRFNWMSFPQSKTRFSPEELNYIETLDVEKDIALLKEKIPSISADVLYRIKIATLLLKLAARRGLTPYQIGELMIGKHSEGWLKLLNNFIPVPSLHPADFERQICKQLQNGQNIEQFLKRKIEQYLTQV